MIDEFLFLLVRAAMYFFIFYFFYRVIVGFVRGLMGNERKPPPSEHPPQTPPQKPVQTYTDVQEAKFKDIPPESKN